MKEIVVAKEGTCTRYIKAFTLFKDLPAQQLAHIAVSDLIQRDEIDRDILNVNGGAIALGHSVGSSSATRLVLTLLKEMQRRDLDLGLVTLCVGGGQGASVVVERP